MSRAALSEDRKNIKNKKAQVLFKSFRSEPFAYEARWPSSGNLSSPFVRQNSPIRPVNTPTNRGLKAGQKSYWQSACNPNFETRSSDITNSLTVRASEPLIAGHVTHRN